MIVSMNISQILMGFLAFRKCIYYIYIYIIYKYSAPPQKKNKYTNIIYIIYIYIQ